MTPPWLAVMLLTYPWPEERRSYAEKTLESCLRNLSYSGPVLVHIASDAAPEEAPEGHMTYLFNLVRQAGYKLTESYSGHRGYGASYNLATQEIHGLAEYILPLEDDWELTQPLDIDRLVGSLEAMVGYVGCIRLGYIGFTQELRNTWIHANGDTYLLFDPDSPEPHVWAGHPRLEAKWWQRRLGPWPEGLDPGSTEFTVAKRQESREGVVWPADIVHPWGNMFAHIGSEQARGDQK